MVDWILRFVKGVFIGSGFILPGVSGGALAAVLGLYERIISFLAHITHSFKKNLLYLIPIGLGGMTGVFLFSFVVSFFLEVYETQLLWLFVGCILGTLPTLWNQAGRKGRQRKHIIILGVIFFASLVFMLCGEQFFKGNVPQNFATWMLAGALIGIGAIVPGLSSSNFLVYMGIYKAVTDGIKDLNVVVIVPIAIGAALTVLVFSKVMDYALEKAYTGVFHGILGIVIASTFIIIPRNFNYLSFDTIPCLLICAAGAALGYWLCTLEKTHKRAAVRPETESEA